MTSEPTTCFGCGASEQLQRVGDTVFCRACLGRMLRRVDERAPRSPGPRDRGGGSGRGPAPAGEAVSGPGDRSPPARAALARTPAADAPCFLCGEPLDGAALIELRGFAICAICARGLVGDDAPAGERAPAGRGAAEPAAAPDSTAERGAGGAVGSADPAQRPRDPAPAWTPGSGTEWCARCDRPMPGPGSYVLIEGRPHCAACAASLAHDRQRRGAPPLAADACDACERPLGTAPVRRTDGFQLCAACLHSDRELALALARARHQHRLARTSRRVLDGDDE